MAAQIPEPPDDSYALVGEPPVQVVLHRDDAAARAVRSDYTDIPTEARWFAVHDESILVTWTQATTVDPDEVTDDLPPGLNRWHVDHLVPAGERGPLAERIGEHVVVIEAAAGAALCVAHGERYQVPHELERLRQREGGQTGG